MANRGSLWRLTAEKIRSRKVIHKADEQASTQDTYAAIVGVRRGSHPVRRRDAEAGEHQPTQEAIIATHKAKQAMIKASTVARYFLSLTDEEAGDTISNLKLQKLLYYAQGFHLAVVGEPLFGERVEAWTHGPVVPDVYHLYKHMGSSAIERPEEFDPGEVDEQARSILDEVYDVYGQYSAWKLREMTHLESPWLDAYKKGPGSAIEPGRMAEYFKTRLVQ